METISILIADDHAVLRSGLKALLSNTSRFQVVGEAGDGWETIRLAEALLPDVIVLDLSMPGPSGMQCIKEIRRRSLPCRILVLTMHDEDDYIREVMLAGADGFVPKRSADTELITGINKVASGQKYLNEAAAQALLATLLHNPALNGSGQDPYLTLSAREREVLRLLAQGHTNPEIAQMLSISPKTVDTYRSRVMQKLNLRKRSELVAYALNKKLLPTFM